MWIRACTKRGIIAAMTSGGIHLRLLRKWRWRFCCGGAAGSRGDAAMRAGRFQEGIRPGNQPRRAHRSALSGSGASGPMARYGGALGMRVIAWSQNLTDERPKKRAPNASTRTGSFPSRTPSRCILSSGPVRAG